MVRNWAVRIRTAHHMVCVSNILPVIEAIAKRIESRIDVDAYYMDHRWRLHFCWRIHGRAMAFHYAIDEKMLLNLGYSSAANHVVSRFLEYHGNNSCQYWEIVESPSQKFLTITEGDLSVEIPVSEVTLFTFAGGGHRVTIETMLPPMCRISNQLGSAIELDGIHLQAAILDIQPRSDGAYRFVFSPLGERIQIDVNTSRRILKIWTSFAPQSSRVEHPEESAVTQGARALGVDEQMLRHFLEVATTRPLPPIRNTRTLRRSERIEYPVLEEMWRVPHFAGFDFSGYGDEGIKAIGDTSCQYNARSPYIRCAINPCGPCEGCIHYEPTTPS
ncbi:DUF6464 family protein [Iningainema tapete]